MTNLRESFIITIPSLVFFPLPEIPNPGLQIQINQTRDLRNLFHLGDPNKTHQSIRYRVNSVKDGVAKVFKNEWTSQRLCECCLFIEHEAIQNLWVWYILCLEKLSSLRLLPSLLRVAPSTSFPVSIDMKTRLAAWLTCSAVFER